MAPQAGSRLWRAFQPACFLTFYRIRAEAGGTKTANNPSRRPLTSAFSNTSPAAAAGCGGVVTPEDGFLLGVEGLESSRALCSPNCCSMKCSQLLPAQAAPRAHGTAPAPVPVSRCNSERSRTKDAASCALLRARQQAAFPKIQENWGYTETPLLLWAA